MLEYIVGLDLGQARDYTALTVLQRVLLPANDEGRQLAEYQARELMRFPLGTAYPEIVATVIGLLHRAPLEAAPLVVDGTGVGRAVVDLFRPLGARLRPITITGGNTVTELDGYTHVPKRDLVGVVQMLLQTRRLKVAPSLPEAATLVAELQAFQVKLSELGHDSYGSWREGSHDDLVLALAMACWYGEKDPGRAGVWFLDVHQDYERVLS